MTRQLLIIKKKATIPGKGVLNNYISELIMTGLMISISQITL